ncbi:ABC transporter permease [Vibrio chagasii]|uniref:ABC transporter permease n=1 Tax=Vibrio TaxID=662 RepID=UPI000E32AC3C|nr:MULTISPECIES: ABC transporter permease [Vibrio]MCG9672209.1 ABC transporter permease [Vibrio chagasii]CAH6812457.1 Multidrug ABC transporter permease [Vibrio chagasii]CAH7017990.1 Multidrug ABC transporter permease [Vibrio chagasii]CAH7036535.1 Multidrug ABC transporter permease [Vibrio chagasii]CAH7227533.1 ABC transporter permease [Vibrio chagasii]
MSANSHLPEHHKTINSLLRQWAIVRKDKWLLSCLTWIPLLLAASIWLIFSQGIARDLPVAVVDLEHSQISQQFTRLVDASPTLQVTQKYSSASEAAKAMIERDIYGYVVIPRHFDRDLYLGLNPQVSVFYNSQFILIGKLVNSALLQAQGTFNAQLEVIKQLSHGDTTVKSALGQAVTVQSQITPLFNKNTSYAQFLVSAVIPALWQIMIVVGTILVLTANVRARGLKAWLSHSPVKSLALTLTPYVVLFLAFGIAFSFWFYRLLEWPFNGSFMALTIAQLLTVISCIIMGCLFFFLTLDPARAMSFAGAFTAPSFAFMGITFPVTDMNTAAQVWRSLLPVSHYIEIQTAQSSYGVSAAQSLMNLTSMFWYVIPSFVVILLINKHLAQAAQSTQAEHKGVNQ